MSGELLLNSWKEIADYIGRSERTVQRWERQFGLPVRRPAGKARSAVIALPSEIEVWSRNAPKSREATRPSRVVRSRLEPPSNTPDAQPTLLCIDGCAEGLAVRKVLLETVGYRVLTATTGRSGLRAFAKYPVDLVIMDRSLPGLDGDALARRLHELKPRIPILLLSGAVGNICSPVLRLVDKFVQKGEPLGMLLAAVGDLCASRASDVLPKGVVDIRLTAERDSAA